VSQDDAPPQNPSATAEPGVDAAEDEGPEAPGRHPRTTQGLLGALVVTLLFVAAFVGFRALVTDSPEGPPRVVDYLSTVEALQDSGSELVYPTSLPDGWVATSLDVVPGERPAWGLGMLTDEGGFVGLRQEDADVDELIAAYVDPDAEPGDQSVFASGLSTGPWQTWADIGGDLAFSTTLTSKSKNSIGETLLVYGSATRDEQEQLIALLTEAPLG
jgi:hypothetical protein